MLQQRRNSKGRGWCTQVPRLCRTEGCRLCRPLGTAKGGIIPQRASPLFLGSFWQSGSSKHTLETQPLAPACETTEWGNGLGQRGTLTTIQFQPPAMGQTRLPPDQTAHPIQPGMQSSRPAALCCPKPPLSTPEQVKWDLAVPGDVIALDPASFTPWGRLENPNRSFGTHCPREPSVSGQGKQHPDKAGHGTG